MKYKLISIKHKQPIEYAAPPVISQRGEPLAPARLHPIANNNSR